MDNHGYRLISVDDEIHHATLEALIKCADAPTEGTRGLLHTASVAIRSKVIDIMMLHKNGTPKDANATWRFMKRAASIREELLATASDNATEHGELDEDAVSLCYQRLGHNLITHDLLPHQEQDKRYRLRNKFEGDMHLSMFQRSFVDSMLLKALGEKRIAFLIWQHGLPSIVDPPAFKWLDKRMLQSSLDECHQPYSYRIDMRMLQRGLDECLQWYVALANDIVVHQTQEGFDVQLSASSVDEEERISMDIHGYP